MKYESEERMYETYGEYYSKIAWKFLEVHKLEVLALLGIVLGARIFAQIGLNHFNNRFIVAIPFVLIIVILYIMAKKEALNERK